MGGGGGGGGKADKKGLHDTLAVLQIRSYTLSKLLTKKLLYFQYPQQSLKKKVFHEVLIVATGR